MNESALNELSRIADLAAGSYEYVVRLRDLVLDDDKAAEPVLKRILDDPSADERRRFDAYYALSILYRRHERVTDFCLLTERYNDRFREAYPLTQVNRALYFRYKYRTSEDWDYLLSSIECAEKAVDAIADNPGVDQTYASAVVLALEKGVEGVPEEKIRKALRLIDRAIDRKSYPKYYSTKGRLLFQRGKFAEACELLEKAIDLERLSDKDSVLRTTQYYFHLIEIKSKQMFTELDTKLAATTRTINEDLATSKQTAGRLFRDLDAVKSKYLELLAFFASVLAFIMATINIVGNFSFREAAALLLVMGGVLNLSFSVLRLLIDYNSSRHTYLKTAVIFTIGALLIAAGYCAGAAGGSC